MLDTQLTRHGIPRLTQFQGNFYESSINILVFLEGYPADGVDFESINTFHTTVADATYCFPAIIHDYQRLLNIGIYIVRVNQVICCFPPTGRSILIINDPQPVATIPEVIFSSPYRELLPNFNVNGGNPLPIAALPYFPEIEQIPRIRVLVTYKSRWSDTSCNDPENPKFVVHLLDESDEVRVYARAQVALDLYDKLEAGKIYYITNLGRRSCDGFFFNLSNPNSLRLTRYTVVEECHDLDDPKLRFDFVALPKLCSYYQENDEMGHRRSCLLVDVIGVLQTVVALKEVASYRINLGKLPRRDAVIFDQSGQTLPCVIWAHNAKEFDAKPGTIVAFRNAILLRKGFTLTEPPPETDGVPLILSVVTPSTFHIEPDAEECFALRQWYNSRPQVSTTLETTICEPCL